MLDSSFRPYFAALGAAILITTLGIHPSSAEQTSAEQKYPDVVSVQVHERSTDTFDFDVTVSSPYDTPQRYADGIRALDSQGTVLGTRKLWHDHASEQPFTRDLYGVHIPAGIRSVTIQARDQKFGYGGKTVNVPLPGR